MQNGKMFVVATPIGNLGDITIRAIDTLKNSDVIMAEDTRYTRGLLTHLGICTKLLSLNSHNEVSKLQYILQTLQTGKNIALVVDAGTPLISDPGGIIVSQLKKADIQVIPIPGPSALICALSASGNINKRFTFEGFLSSKRMSRKNELDSLKYEDRTMVFYEAPHRLLQTLRDMEEVFGKDRRMTLAKELTKIHENIISGTILDIILWIEEDELRQKGEFVLIVYRAHENKSDEEYIKLVLQALLKKLSVKDAVETAHEITKCGKNKLYNLTKKIST